MVNQSFRIKIAYRSKEEEGKEKIPGIGRYPVSDNDSEVMKLWQRTN